MAKPPDARTLRTEPPSSLFVQAQSHSTVARETAAKLDAYAKGTPASLGKFYAARERIAREAGLGAGSSGAGSPAVTVAQPPLNDASRDPRLRR
jgi:hypothetical protein